jgi:UDP-2,3-diacylglucosamine pyrophosphatase LpxH
MAGSKYIFFSDIHIGMNTPVNWYQQSVHEPYVLAALKYVQGLGQDVEDLVILGDMVDQWTELPTNPPPTFSGITNANPNVFGTASNPGALLQCLDSVSGQVCYVNGNHDMFVTGDEIITLKSAQGNLVNYIDGGQYTHPELEGILALHGHQYSMLCNPDFEEDPANLGAGHHGGLPLGHFVTRLCAQWASKQIANSNGKWKTVADMPNTGYPTGWPVDVEAIKELLETIAKDITNLKEPALSQMVLDVLAGVAGVDQTQKFQMFHGYDTLTVTDAINQYADVFSNWVAKYDFASASSSLIEADIEDNLAIFADYLRLSESEKVVIMGHTHQAVLEKHDLLNFIYANSGFNCPSIPDRERKSDPENPTFIELEVGAKDYVVNLMEVVLDPDGGLAVLQQSTASVKKPII